MVLCRLTRCPESPDLKIFVNTFSCVVSQNLSPSTIHPAEIINHHTSHDVTSKLTLTLSKLILLIDMRTCRVCIKQKED